MGHAEAMQANHPTEDAKGIATVSDRNGTSAVTNASNVSRP